MKTRILLLIAILNTMGLACSPAAFTTTVNGVTKGNISLETPICSPFGGGPGGANSGLKGSLYSLNSSQPHYVGVDNYIAYGDLISSSVFISQLAVPTTKFNLGFIKPDGTALNDTDGNRLVEWFALDLDTQIKLTANDLDGDYQFALLADDGAVFELQNSNGNLQTLVNDDGTHETTFVCATQVVHFDHNSQIPAKIKYYQGPREFIALSLMWKKINPGSSPSALNDPACGLRSNDAFFDYNQTPSAPQQTYKDMLSRGWKPLDTGNFVLPGNQNNPCL